MSERIRIFATVTTVADNAKKRIAITVSTKKFKTVSDVQYNVLSLLDIAVGDGIVELLVNKYLTPPSEPSTIFRDEDRVRINVHPNCTKVKALKSVRRPKKVKKQEYVSDASKQKEGKQKEVPNSINPTVPRDTVDVSSIWLQMKASNPAPVNVATNKRKFPQNNEELRYNYERATNVEPIQRSSVASEVSTSQLGSNASNGRNKRPILEKPTETRVNYNQLPMVKSLSSLMVGDEVVVKYVTLCDKTFTPTLSPFLKINVVSLSETTVTVDVTKVDRMDKQYHVGQRVDFKWSEWGEVRMLKKFIPPLPPGPPPISVTTAAAAVKDSESVQNLEEEREADGLSLFSLFSEDLQRKKISLS